MPHTIQSFSASDGYEFKYRHYQPEDSPKGHIIALHGIQSHSGWYDHSSSRLAAAGYSVNYLDRRGSGLNNQNRGDTPGFRRLLDDVGEFAANIRSKGDGKRTICLAVSWGGKLGAALSHRHPGSIDALGLLCPGICPRISPSLGRRLAILGSRFLKPGKMFPIPLNDPKLFTDNPDRQKYIADDPLCLRLATARFLVESVRLDIYLKRTATSNTLPVLLMLAGYDRIIDNPRTRDRLETWPAPVKSIIEYPDAHHTLEFEPSPDFFINDLIAWLDGLAK